VEHSEEVTALVKIRRARYGLFAVCLLVASISDGQATPPVQTTPVPAADSNSNDLVIAETVLPAAYPGTLYVFRFLAHGGTGQLHWRIEKGVLPPGITLSDDGELRGASERVGEYHFTVAVRDSGSPQQAVQREFELHVVAALSLQWKTGPRVNGSRIDGTVQVMNTTPYDINLTFDVKAVADNGRATEIGYQHFVLKHSPTPTELPFGENLPFGAYKIYVLAVGEVPERKLIYKEQLETPASLRVQVGP
jgi:hypothetical protein